ncbi:MAG: conjugal transfer protein TraF [Proteobacteria bacterium]|nr:conjugal transfer protein TraF [Pseudomonadota bacterium]
MKKFLFYMVLLTMAWGMMPAIAAEFQSIGYEAISMGGAGVAASRGSYAPYYNPALLGRPRHSVEISLSPGIGFRETNLVDHIDTLAAIDVDATLDSLTNIDYGDLSGYSLDDEIVSVDNPQLSADVATIKGELRALSGKNGLELMPNVALAAQVGHWGVGAYIMAEATAFAIVDSERLEFIVPYSNGGPTFYVKYDEQNLGI